MSEEPFLEICLHWPHDRFALGWEFIQKDEEYNYSTLRLYLLVITLTFNK